MDGFGQPLGASDNEAIARHVSEPKHELSLVSIAMIVILESVFSLLLFKFEFEFQMLQALIVTISEQCDVDRVERMDPLISSRYTISFHRISQEQWSRTNRSAPGFPPGTNATNIEIVKRLHCFSIWETLRYFLGCKGEEECPLDWLGW